MAPMTDSTRRVPKMTVHRCGNQEALVLAIRDAAVGVLDKVQALGLHSKAKESLPTAMRVASVRSLFGTCRADVEALSTLDHLASARSSQAT